MPGGVVKKSVAKKALRKKAPVKKKIVKVPAKPAISKARKKVASKKPVKKSIKKASGKINLKVRAIKTPATKKAPTKKIVSKPSATKAPKVVTKSKVVKKIKKQAVKSVVVKKSEVAIPKGRIIAKRTEKDKRFLMWAGVSFFMILIVIFWIYNTKESIKQSSLKWQSSEKATAWNQMADELSDKIVEMRNDIKAVRSFASSSREQALQTEDNPTIFQSSGSSTETINDKLVKDLKHNLEIKTGISEPAEGDYFFTLESENLAVLLSALKDVKIGDDLAQVKAVLGEPNFEQELTDKRGAFVTKIITYYVKIYQKDTINKQYDRYISLEFDQNDTLLKINKFLD